MSLGLALPSFVEDPEVPLNVARAAEAAGVDGVFVYDHLFRRDRAGTRRPALEGLALLGAVAGATTTITVGTLVLRSSLRPPATLATAVETVARIAPGRLVAGIGAGDAESREEDETFGLGSAIARDRVEQLEVTVRMCRDRGARVWVGGTARPARDVASRVGDGWNAWGIDAAAFASLAPQVRAAATHEQFECSWGGLAVIGESDDAARAKAERLGAVPQAIVGSPDTVASALDAYRDAGADWVIVAPVDSSDASNATVLGARVRPRLSR
jgi:alkanesulfonate monooxygenase SsuD/methylene tetrahydromethanopterin reductase-like flavin-dependent oxidoreductase (luciferase family)